MSRKQSSNNVAIISCAGSGKTTFIVEEALKVKNEQVLVTTYTSENLNQIETMFVEKCGYIPSNITIQSWYTFLLREGVRPYQNQLIGSQRIISIFFQLKGSTYQRKENYVTNTNNIYSNKVAEFVYECNKKCNGLIINRLEQIYAHIYIDELQDFAGYDLNVLEMLFHSNIYIVAVGDPRQATFSTNNAQKNKKYRKSEIYRWLNEIEDSGQIEIKESSNCHRCNQKICDFADAIFPEFPRTKSTNSTETDHNGVFCIQAENVEIYASTYSPTVLRYNKKVDTFGLEAINIGLSKGRTYERVLVFPTKPMKDYLITQDINKAGDKSKLYVAVTRAMHSVVFVVDDAKKYPLPEFNSF